MKKNIVITTIILFSFFATSQTISSIYVGNNRYNSSSINNLHFAENSVNYLNRIICENKAELLVNHSLRNNQITNKIEDQIRILKQNDILFFYFVGHGKIGYLILPGYRNDIAPSNQSECTISKADIDTLSKHCSGDSIYFVVIIDACYAGSFLDEIDTTYDYRFLACQPDQVAKGLDRTNVELFTFFLGKSIKDHHIIDMNRITFNVLKTSRSTQKPVSNKTKLRLPYCSNNKIGLTTPPQVIDPFFLNICNKFTKELIRKNLIDGEDSSAYDYYVVASEIYKSNYASIDTSNIYINKLDDLKYSLISSLVDTAISITIPTIRVFDTIKYPIINAMPDIGVDKIKYAISCLDTAINLSGEGIYSSKLLNRQYYLKALLASNEEQAETLIDASIEAYPNSAYPYLLKAQMDKEKNPDLALDNLNKYNELAPEDSLLIDSLKEQIIQLSFMRRMESLYSLSYSNLGALYDLMAIDTIEKNEHIDISDLLEIYANYHLNDSLWLKQCSKTWKIPVHDTLQHACHTVILENKFNIIYPTGSLNQIDTFMLNDTLIFYYDKENGSIDTLFLTITDSRDKKTIITKVLIPEILIFKTGGSLASIEEMRFWETKIVIDERFKPGRYYYWEVRSYNKKRFIDKGYFTVEE